MPLIAALCLSLGIGDALSKPELPCIWIGKECGLLFIDDLEEIRVTSVKDILGGSYKELNLFSSDGVIWGVKVAENIEISLLDKTLAYTIFNRPLKVKLQYFKKDKISLADLKNKILEQSRKDPGDLMWQFIEPEEIEREVPKAETFNDLFLFCKERILGLGIE